LVANFFGLGKIILAADENAVFIIQERGDDPDIQVPPLLVFIDVIAQEDDLGMKLLGDFQEPLGHRLADDALRALAIHNHRKSGLQNDVRELRIIDLDHLDHRTPRADPDIIPCWTAAIKTLTDLK
jgi:hypothetical protein